MKKLFFGLLFTFGCVSLVNADVNVRLDPIGPLIGQYGVDVDFPISSAWTLGPSLKYLNREDGDFDVSGYSVGVRGNYWFNGEVLTQGWYFGPLLQYIGVSVEDNSDGSDLEGSANGAGLTAFFGYQWMWESFNINLGAGPALYTVNDIEVDDGDGNKEEYRGYSGVGLALEFSLGWKF
jgi:hypothetical protein